MIEPSALPSIAKLLTAGAPQGEALAESPISAQFAQLLALQFGVAPATGDAPQTVAPPVLAHPGPAIGKHSGKPGGKHLPDMPAVAPESIEAPASDVAPEADAAGKEASTSGIASPLPQAPAMPIAALALLPTVDPAPATGAFKAAQAPARQPARALPAMPAALRLPETAITPSEKPRMVAAPGTAGGPAAALDSSAEAAIPSAPLAIIPSAPQAAVPSVPQAAMPSAPQAAFPSAPQAAGARPGGTIQPVRFVTPAPVVSVQPLARSLAALRLVPRKPETGEAAGRAIDLQPLPAAEQTAPSSPPAPMVQPSAAMQLVASLRQILLRGRADQPQAGNAVPIPPTLAPAAPPSVEPLAAEPLASEPMTAEPMTSDRTLPADGQSRPISLVTAATELVPELANMVPAPGAAPSPAASQASSPAPGLQAPVDFAQLIDRLVEAREAMRSAQPAPSVEAAIAHAEFGQVSMRFDQAGGGLSVSLASPDPDFTRAVQAAAPAVQQSTAPDSGGAPAQRHDAPGQQGAGAAPGQSHSQQRGQPAAQHSGEPSRQPAAQSQPRAEAPSPRRGGIFA